MDSLANYWTSWEIRGSAHIADWLDTTFVELWPDEPVEPGRDMSAWGDAWPSEE
jgi:hypothetical protein